MSPTYATSWRGRCRRVLAAIGRRFVRSLRSLVTLAALIGRPTRFILIALLIAFARGLGGTRYTPHPAPRNLPAEVERKS